jgi:hypothetical protein
MALSSHIARVFRAKDANGKGRKGEVQVTVPEDPQMKQMDADVRGLNPRRAGDSGGSNSRRYVWVSAGNLPGVSEPYLSSITTTSFASCYGRLAQDREVWR